jgi:two-component system, NtrC family, sensor kinase
MAVEKHAPTEVEIQEKMWIEIIETMETMYGTLAAAQTEMEKKNAELHRFNEVVRNVIGSMINALVVADRGGRITLSNEACSRALGYSQEEIIGKPLEKFFAPGARNAIYPGSAAWKQLREVGAMRDVETEVLLADGQAIPVSINASVMCDRSGGMDGALLVAYDLRPLQMALKKVQSEAQEAERSYRELKALQSKLIQSEKMSSLGRMAAGVAHEINNPLGAILVYSHLLLEDTTNNVQQRETLKKVIRETTRCKEIVQELLGFSRTQQDKRRVLDLGRVVLAALDLVRPQPLFQNVVQDLETSETPVYVEVDLNLLLQAFMNILINAAEAMEGVGTISIRTWADEARRVANIRIADSGPGIPIGLLGQLFEPFFTTKDEGHGTGLGLSIVYHIVRQHGGAIEARNRPGGGAEFVISLPLKTIEEAPS